jgi:hypothetical protein
VTGADDPESAAFRARAAEIVAAPSSPVAVLGIDATRRGRPRWAWCEQAGTWVLSARYAWRDLDRKDEANEDNCRSAVRARSRLENR